jgi:hypothetical protein
VALSLMGEFEVTDPELICAALLHDMIEDASVKPDLLRKKFGAHCTNLVEALTRQRGEQRGKTGDQFKGKYLRKIFHAGNDAICLKLADKLDNLRDAIHHPDRSRVTVFFSETFPAYLPLARALTPPLIGARAERLLLEAAARTGNADAPEFLAALMDSTRRALVNSRDDDTALNDIAFPEIAAKLYLYLNPDAQRWLEFDGASLLVTQVPHLQLATRIARGLRDIILGHDLEVLLRLAGLPVAFASAENQSLWHRAALHLMYIQRLLREPQRFGWFKALTSESNLPLLLALIQSRTYLPASWRCPLWSEDLGATLSQRGWLLSKSAAARLLPGIIGRRLALTRYVQGSGTLHRAESVLGQLAGKRFSPTGLWALRIASEYLEAQTALGAEDRPGSEICRVAALDNLWDQVKAAPFESASLPERGPEIAQAAGSTDVANQIASIEVTGLHETWKVFESADAGTSFQRLIQALIHHTQASDKLTWLDFDAVEWEKRRKYWSRPNALRGEKFARTGSMEEGGVRLRRYPFYDCELLRVLPARRFAFQDRLPEITADMLDQLMRTGFTAVSMFDRIIMNSADREWWLPRVYRVLDTLEDLDPENVQAITITYDGPEDIPPLTAYLPLPTTANDPGQQSRKRFLARYIVAQIYNCAVVRWVRRVTFRCSAVSAAQAAHAFTEEELKALLAEAERDYGYRQAYANYIERYGYNPFLVLPSATVPESLTFGREQIKKGLYLGIDIGGSFIKFEMFRDGEPFTGTARVSLVTPKEMELAAFCRAILLHCDSWLVANAVKWSDVDGIGISWPGAVRENRLAGASGVLRRLRHHQVAFKDDDPINRLPDLQLAACFREELERIAGQAGDRPGEHFTIAIQNDGDAEALGNHALRVKQGDVKLGGKIFVKLGTSVAGGRITAEGAIAEEVAEYGKIVLNLNCAADPKWPCGTARYYASAVGVRQLTRTFLHEREPLFGSRDGLNEEGNKDHIEPVELGMLLPLCGAAEGRERLLAHLIEHDNHPPKEVTQAIAALVESALQTSKRDLLISYIQSCGGRGAQPESHHTAGLKRLIWLCTGQNVASFELAGQSLPPDFPFGAMARAVVGTFGLFSQLSLQLAHLIAQLYNVYRRGVFSEVILSGGVLGGETGDLVETQTKAFLSKYYDKIYGPGRPLARDAVTRAGFEGVSNAGVFGAAMAANRLRQINAAQALVQAIHYRMKQCAVGEVVRVDDLLDDLIKACPLPQAWDVGRSVVEAAVVAGSFIWIDQNVLQRIS